MANCELDIVVNTTEIPKAVPLLDCENSDEPFVLAPGEGFVPTNIMREDDWDSREVSHRSRTCISMEQTINGMCR